MSKEAKTSRPTENVSHAKFCINCGSKVNRADNGGGIYNYFGTLTIIDNAFDRNHADNEGDDIFDVLLPPLL